MSPGNECGPALHQQDGTETTTTTGTRQDAQPADDATARPLASSVIGVDALHRLADAGYRVTAVCRCCGARLVNVASVARSMGPVCSARAGDL